MTSSFISDLNWPVETAKKLMAENETEESEVTLNGKTKVPLVWMVTVAVFILGLVGFGATAIFWMATLNAKVDTLISAKSATEQITQAHDADIRGILSKIAIWENYSGPWTKDMNAIERRVSDIERKSPPAKP